jgi:stress-induced morphogen
MGLSRQESIQTKLKSVLDPEHIEVENESRMHSVPPGSETHFRVLVVSRAFAGQSAVQRHRRVNEALRDEFSSGLHALTLRAMTPEEWAQQGAAGFQSPPCLGGSKAD